MACCRAVLLSMSMLGLLASRRLWLSSRTFPLLPVASWFPSLSAPWDQWLFGAVLLSLLLACWWYRTMVLFFLSAMLFLYLGDQNRGQPWIYMYWTTLGMTLFPEEIALSAGRVILSAVYVWGGIHKCNPKFFQFVPEWFVSPAAVWGWSASVIDLCALAVATAPAAEVLIGILFWVPSRRWIALGAAVIIHGAALLFLGPIGHGYNWVVWPWNVAMPLLAFIFFAPSATLRAWESLEPLRRSKRALAIVSLICLLPVLNFFGWWDSYFSFS